MQNDRIAIRPPVASIAACGCREGTGLCVQARGLRAWMNLSRDRGDWPAYDLAVDAARAHVRAMVDAR